MRTFMPSEHNHQDIDPNFLTTPIPSNKNSTPYSEKKTKQQPTPAPSPLENNDFLLPLIFLLLYLMEKEENK